MGIRYEWADDKKIIMNVFVEFPWTWKEYLSAMEPMMKELKEKETPCATVVDLSQMKVLPKDGNILQILLHVDKIMPSNVFASTMVGANPMVMAFMNVLTKLRPNAKRLVSFTRTLEEGHKIIYKRYENQFPNPPLPYQPKEG
ncbi:MAG: hypothetical protein SFZ02_05920 [bacterium]|nr:hypothetical protein [bacterium]